MASIPQKEKRPLTRRMRRYGLPLLAGLLLTFFAAGCRPEAERRPFAELTADQVKEIRIEYPTEASYTYLILNQEQTDEIIGILNALTVLGEQDTVYYGQVWRVVIRYGDGSQTAVSGAGSESVAIDDQAYRWTEESCEALHTVCNRWRDSI